MRKKWARAITSRLSVMALVDLFQELDVMRGQAIRSCALPQQCEIAKRGAAVVIMAAGHGSCGLKPYSEGIHRRQQSACHCGGAASRGIFEIAGAVGSDRYSDHRKGGRIEPQR